MTEEKSFKETKPYFYAIGMFGTSLPINLFKTFAMMFYVNMLGLPLTQWAFIVFVDTFIDAADNPIYGYFSDRTRTRWGRRKPWIIPGAVFFGLVLIAFFNPPASLSAATLMPYCMVTYILTYTLNSLVGTSYGALFPDLFRTEDKRAVTNMFRQIFQFIAMAISIAVTPVIADKIGYGNTALIYGITGAAVIIISNLNCHENLEEIKTLEKPRLLPCLIAILKNKKFWISGFTGAFYSAAMSMLMASMTFFAVYTLGINPVQTTMLFGTVLVVAIGGVPVWTKFIRKYTVLPVWKLALLALCISFIPLYLSFNLVTAVIAAVVLGFAYSGVVSTFDLVGAKIIDDDRERSGGIRREGMFSSISSFMNRLNGVFVSFGLLLTSLIYGYVNGENPGDRPGEAARFMLSAFPFFLMVISVVLSRFLKFPETKKQTEESI